MLLRDVTSEKEKCLGKGMGYTLELLLFMREVLEGDSSLLTYSHTHI
jgi:hypothetical protein